MYTQLQNNCLRCFLLARRRFVLFSVLQLLQRLYSVSRVVSFWGWCLHNRIRGLALMECMLTD
jgi:hypothetical protein